MRYVPVLLIGLLVAGPAQALRCGNMIVSEGDDTYQLTQRCGQPTSVERIDAPVVNQRVYDAWGRPAGYMPVSVGDSYEIWVYNFGPQRFVARITVKKARIFKIDEAGYGH